VCVQDLARVALHVDLADTEATACVNIVLKTLEDVTRLINAAALPSVIVPNALARGIATMPQTHFALQERNAAQVNAQRDVNEEVSS
jgi:hypothetical protein